ncbi:L-histidine N(alpha)-methyltransferase [uncultured Winogradskyella sp.]|uniref:L-histidine N(alpha)-methyltransferase n=1 Tax=uncultured Winogradskyella sp. TaxID=395353 RepID=UPI0035136990
MTDSFAQDVHKGLSAEHKFLPSKYFYDDNGSRLFKQIMDMPEYYLTNSEFEIISLQSKQIFKALEFSQPFNIVELGAGDGLKTFKFLEFLVQQDIKFNYVPVDISSEAMEMLTANLEKRLPGIVIKPKVGDYFKILSINKTSQYPSLLLFLGSNIGNYKQDKAKELLKLFNANMKKGDKLLVGFDLKKNPLTVHKAYFDSQGITKRFNLNLLLRINRELDADFQIDNFDFYCHYNPLSGDVRSYIVSLRAQQVHIKKIDKVFNFDYNELISTELSKKYSLEEIGALAKNADFKLKTNFLDCKHYFTDSLWEK